MPRMSKVAKAIQNTRDSTWFTPTWDEPKTKSDKYKHFCLCQCPHPDKPCDGICAEFKAFMKRKGRDI